MSKYKFDLKSGHYIVINEGEAPAQTDGTDNSATTSNKEDASQSVSLKNLENEDVLKLKKQLSVDMTNFDKEIDTKQNIILQVKEKIANLEKSESTTQLALNTLQKLLLLAEADLNGKQFEKAKKLHDTNKTIFDLQLSLITENLNALKLPEQYKNLNEQDINNNKIYINNFVGLNNVIKNINEFKNAFKMSKLLYGTDSNGYFAVCFNNDDVNNLQNTLLEAGCNYDMIIATITPLLI